MKPRTPVDLATLKQALQDAQRLKSEHADHERVRAARERRERELFAATVGAVVPLRKVAPVVPARPRPEAIAHQRQRDEAAVLSESISDAFDVESLLETDDALSFRRRGVGPDVVRKLRRGVWVTQAELDLHGLRRDAARERLGAFLRDAVGAGLRCVRVIHGKGHGSPGRAPVLKARVGSWLAQKNEVIAFTQARACDGGNGALMVLLDAARAAA